MVRQVEVVDGPITTLLNRWGGGDGTALDELMPVVYAELRRVASRSLMRERVDHTLQTTALVHETYLRLMRSVPPDVQNRRHFYALIARLMRHVLVDHARSLQTGRRGGGAIKIALDHVQLMDNRSLVDVLALDQALEALRRIDPRKAQIVELRFFGGLDVEETAVALGVSAPTVIKDTRLAKAWLVARMRQPEVRS